MFDIGWSEIAIIVVVALVVLGPKELPNALRMATQWIRYARKMASEFQGGIDQMVREAELDEARKAVQSVASMDLEHEIKQAVDPTGDIMKSMNPQIEEAPPPPQASLTSTAPAPVLSEAAAPEAPPFGMPSSLPEPPQPPAPLAVAPETVMPTPAPAIDEAAPAEKVG
jgi:sec-independent protein translocase protein TatB